jgi:F0F1-type ATP synthase assembly protein I
MPAKRQQRPKGAALLDLSARRDLHNGFGDALATAVEMAVTPAVFAYLGWRLDAWLGTAPLFLIALFLFTMGYVIWKQWHRYEERMRTEERELLGPKASANASPNGELR